MEAHISYDSKTNMVTFRGKLPNSFSPPYLKVLPEGGVLLDLGLVLHGELLELLLEGLQLPRHLRQLVLGQGGALLPVTPLLQLLLLNGPDSRPSSHLGNDCLFITWVMLWGALEGAEGLELGEDPLHDLGVTPGHLGVVVGHVDGLLELLADLGAEALGGVVDGADVAEH